MNNKRPNILFILTDDQRFDAMGFMGNRQVYTPNLDQLAAQSIVFRNAFHVAPICMPSRASIQLGKYIAQHHCGFDLPTDYSITYKEYQDSYPVLLRKNGYYTGFIGKFGFTVIENKNHNNIREIDPTSPENDKYYKVIKYFDNDEECFPKKEFDVWNGFTGQGKYFADKNNCFNGYKNKWNTDHLTTFNAYQANEFLENAKELNKPFSLSISFKAPHRPSTASKKWQEFYKDITINRMPNDSPDYFKLLPKVVRTHSRNAAEYWGSDKLKKQIPSWLPWKDEEVFQKEFKNYYGLISGIDEAVGMIRDKLRELKLDDNTIIIYTSDNGYFCGSKQLGGKELLYEESIKAPMVVYDPRKKPEECGKWVDGIVSTVDICPTILDYAGIKKPECMFGTSFRPIVDNEKDEIHEAVYGENDFNDNYIDIDHHPHPNEYQSIHSKYVRTKSFKYIRYHLCHPVIEEMWKIDDDPLETNNLVGNPDYEEELNKMRKLLDDFNEKTEREYKLYHGLE